MAGASVCGLLSLAYFFAAYLVIFVEKWGPVVAVVDAEAGHGVHSGDLVGLLCGVFGALFGWFSLVLLAEADHGLALRRRAQPAVVPVSTRRTR